MNVPLVILKKQPSKTLHNDLYQTQVTSFTTEKSYELTLSRDVISEDDNILLIDDFKADGEAATGAIRLLRMAHATVLRSHSSLAEERSTSRAMRFTHLHVSSTWMSIR